MCGVGRCGDAYGIVEIQRAVAGQARPWALCADEHDGLVDGDRQVHEVRDLGQHVRTVRHDDAVDAVVGRELLQAARDLHPVRHRGAVLAFGLAQILGRDVRDQRELGQGGDPIVGREARRAVVRDVEPLFGGSRDRAAERDQPDVR